MPSAHLQQSYDELHSEATRLAGGLSDLAQRATVYHHLFEASGGNHAFPLIAAHGALWAGGYFRFGLRLGEALSWQYGLSPAWRRKQLVALDDFANAFRDVNRLVCIDTYVNFHFTARHSHDPRAAEYVPPTLLAALQGILAARRAGVELSDADKRTAFTAHFLHEQQHVVGPALAAAVEAFRWPLVRSIALRPVVRFAYFPGQRRFWFRNFSHREERIEKGLLAFDLAAAVGWQQVEQALRAYRVLPDAFFAGTAEYFGTIKHGILTGGTAPLVLSEAL